MIQLNYRDSRPIYEQIKDGFRQLIVQGIMDKNEQLPSVRELATSLTINPNTIQRAYRELEQEGYVYKIAGKGCFVSGVPDQNTARREELWKEFDMVVSELYYLGVEDDELVERVHRSVNEGGVK